MNRIIALALLLAACATPYQENGFRGGVAAVPMGGNVWRVEGHLNGYSSQSRLQDFMLLRAADTAIANGSPGFIIASAQADNKTGTITTPGTASTQASVTGMGNTAFATAHTTYTPADSEDYIKPGGIMLIQLVPQGYQGAFISAQQIEDAIGPRVRGTH